MKRKVYIDAATNTYASCGRHDPARKRGLNRIPFCRKLDLTSVKKKNVSYGESGTFLHFTSRSDVKMVGLLAQI